MIMWLFYVEINEYYIQAYWSLLISHIIDWTTEQETETQLSWDSYDIRKNWQNMIVNNHLRHTTADTYDNNGKGWYFRIEDDDKITNWWWYLFNLIDLNVSMEHG